MYVYIIIQEESTAHITQIHHEMSEMTSYISVLKKENEKLKSDNKKLTKRYGQNKAEVQTTASLLKVCKCGYIQ